MAAKYKMHFQIQLVVREIKVTQKYPFTSIILRKKMIIYTENMGKIFYPCFYDAKMGVLTHFLNVHSGITYYNENCITL